MAQEYHEESQVDNIAYINQFIGSAPNWLMRSGITMIAIVITVLLIMSFIFKYPDKLTMKGELTSMYPPIDVINKQAGIVSKIYVKDGQSVSSGQEILYIRNNASLPDVGKLESFIKRYKAVNTLNRLIQLRVPEILTLGELQSDYSNLILKIREVQSLVKQTTTLEQIKNINKEIENIKALSQSVAIEKEIFGAEKALIQKDLDRSKTLNSDGVISDQEQEQTATKMLQYDQKQARMSSSIIENDITIEQLEFRKLQLQSERDQAIKQYKFQIAEIISRLESNLISWKDGFLLTAPSDGVLNFNSELVVNKTLEANTSVGYVISREIEQDKYIKAIAPVQGLGKININDRVLIKLDGFPFKEYGILESTLAYISPIPTQIIDGQSFYELRIPLENTLETSYKKIVPFKSKGTASIEIITEDKSISERIFSQILDVMNNG